MIVTPDKNIMRSPWDDLYGIYNTEQWNHLSCLFTRNFDFEYFLRTIENGDNSNTSK